MAGKYIYPKEIEAKQVQDPWIVPTKLSKGTSPTTHNKLLSPFFLLKFVEQRYKWEITAVAEDTSGMS